jgi:hypothetical protein
VELDEPVLCIKERLQILNFSEMFASWIQWETLELSYLMVLYKITLISIKNYIISPISGFWETEVYFALYILSIYVRVSNKCE